MEKDIPIKVSVIIPVYNAEDYIHQCLDSLLQQTLKEFEIICVDDGSTDKSLQIMRDYENMDSRIIVKRQSNKGAGAARNFGLQFAKGEYLSFLDADDFFEPKMLEVCVDTMNREHSDIAGYLAKRFNQEKGLFSLITNSINDSYCPDHSPFSPGEAPKHLFSIFQIALWSKMYRHSFVGKNNLNFQEIPRSNDLAFNFQALALASKISVIRQTFVNYRVNAGNSLQDTKDETPLMFWEAFAEAKKRLVLAGVYGEYEQSFLNCLLEKVLSNIRIVKTEEAREIILACVRGNGEKEFGLLNHPFSYYFSSNLLIKYCMINSHLPIALQLLQEGFKEKQTDLNKKNNRIKKLETDLSKKNNRIEKLETDLNIIKQSKSFLVGEALALPIRKIRKILT